MTAAQITFAVLTVCYLLAGVVLVIAESTAMAWACFTVASFGFLIFAAMLANDMRQP